MSEDPRKTFDPHRWMSYCYLCLAPTGNAGRVCDECGRLAKEASERGSLFVTPLSIGDPRPGSRHDA